MFIILDSWSEVDSMENSYLTELEEALEIEFFLTAYWLI